MKYGLNSLFGIRRKDLRNVILISGIGRSINRFSSIPVNINLRSVIAINLNLYSSIVIK